MGKLKFTLSNIIFWLAIAASCLLLEDVGFLTSNPKGPLGETQFFMLFTLALGGFLSYFLIEHIKNKVTLDYVLVSVLLTCLVGGMLAIWQFNGMDITGVQHFEYSVSNWDKVHHSLSFVIFLLAAYSVLFYFNKNHPSIRKIRVVYAIIMIVGFLGSLYSWVFEFDKIVYNLSATGHPKGIDSFFWNGNMFSLMLLLSLFSCFGLNYFKKNVFSYIGIAYFFLMICIVASLTSTFVCFVSILAYFLIEIIFTIRKHTKRGIALLAVYTSLITALVVMFAVSLNFNLGVFSDFWKSIYAEYTHAHYSDLTSRTYIWDTAIAYTGENPFNLIFGFGFKNSYHVVGGLLYAYRGAATTSLSVHNGYLQVLLNFGIVGVIAIALFLLYYLYCLCRVVKRNGRFAAIFGLMGLCLMGYAVMESIIVLNPNTLGLLICAFFYLPIINYWKHHKHKELGTDLLSVKKPKVVRPQLATKATAKFIVSLLVTLAALFAFPYFREHTRVMYLILNIMVILLLCLLFVPFIVSCISINHRKKVSIFLTVLNFVVVGGPIIYLITRHYVTPTYMAPNAEWIFPVLILLILVGESVIFGVVKHQKFKDYAATFVGMSKNSFMGVLGALAVALTTFFIAGYMDLVSPLTYIIYPILVLLAFYLASYLVPFKDQKEYIQNYNLSLLHMMKKDVLRDRLGEFDEKRRD